MAQLVQLLRHRVAGLQLVEGNGQALFRQALHQCVANLVGGIRCGGHLYLVDLYVA
ncbi:hypothetical protein D9M71_725560 [compost metagenome]